MRVCVPVQGISASISSFSKNDMEHLIVVCLHAIFHTEAFSLGGFMNPSGEIVFTYALIDVASSWALLVLACGQRWGKMGHHFKLAAGEEERDAAPMHTQAHLWYSLGNFCLGRCWGGAERRESKGDVARERRRWWWWLMAGIRGSQWHRTWSFMWTGSSLLHLRRFTLCLLSWNMSSGCTLCFHDSWHSKRLPIVKGPSMCSFLAVFCAVQSYTGRWGPGSLRRKSDPCRVEASQLDGQENHSRAC